MLIKHTPGCPCCFTPGVCKDCYDGTLPQKLWIDIPLLADDECLNCEGYENTYQVVNPNPLYCVWNLQIFDELCPTLSTITFLHGFIVVEESKCWLQAWLAIGQVGAEQSIIWRKEIASPISTIDHILPFWKYITNEAAHCNAAGTTVHIYE